MVALSITWATVDQIEFNYRLEQEAELLRREVGLRQSQVDAQKLNNELLSNEYVQEFLAKSSLGLLTQASRF